MFPDITRDEVFRIETPRLWLRWPMATDDDALAAVMAESCRDTGARLTVFGSAAVQAAIARWRREMEAGSALHLVLAPKRASAAVGIVHATTDADVSCRMLPGEATTSFEPEAVEAVLTMITWLRIVPRTPRVAPMAHQRRFSLRAEFASWCTDA